MRGFSLIELSIVLVILGLLVGGILAGQSLIRASELRSISAEHHRHHAAVNAFRDRYFAFPGDMPNATSIWGAQHATPATCKTTASTTALTCNGDGNRRISAPPSANEYFRFWQHLANAGLIAGTYSGVPFATSDTSSKGGFNAPAGKISGSAWFIANSVARSNHSYWFDGDYGNYFIFGGDRADGEPGTNLSAPDQWNIDVKLDDGFPGTGKLMALNWDYCTDATASSELAGARYLLGSNSLYCAIVFPRVF